jgi:hypothetical protein
VATTGVPKTLKPFVDKGSSMAPKSVKVVAKNSPYQGRNIVIYSTHFIESFIRGYSLALAHRKLRANQVHIGERCVILNFCETLLHFVIAVKKKVFVQTLITLFTLILLIKTRGKL